MGLEGAREARGAACFPSEMSHCVRSAPSLIGELSKGSLES